MSLMGVVIEAGDIRQVPKHALTLEETDFALGSNQLVRDLREIGALVSTKRIGRTLLFDAGDVAQVWADYRAGKFDEALGKLKK